MTTLATLQSRAASLVQEISRLREREAQQQRFINEIEADSRNLRPRIGSPSPAAQAQLQSLQEEQVRQINLLRQTQADIARLTAELQTVNQEIAVAQASPDSLGPPGAESVPPTRTQQSPARQATDTTGTVAESATSLPGLQAELARAETDLTETRRALVATDQRLEELRRFRRDLEGRSGVFGLSAAEQNELENIVRNISELEAQKRSFENQIIPEIEQNIIRLRALIEAEEQRRLESFRVVRDPNLANQFKSLANQAKTSAAKQTQTTQQKPV
jgi:Fe2+ transport system protein B